MRLLICFLTFGLLIGMVSNAEETDKLAKSDPKVEDLYADLEIFANALTIIDTHYVEETKPKEVIYGALKGMLASLDPYSQFLGPPAYKEIKVETEGKFGGIGVEITSRDGVLTVISPVDGTPAAEAGMMPGDRIVKINEKTTRDMTLEDSVKILRGKPGTVVKLTVLRDGVSQLLEFSIKRSIIKVKSIKEAKILKDKIGYIRLSDFQENTPKDLRLALKKLEAKGLKGLILDLRNNPGGLLNVSIEVAQQFVPRGELIVYTKGRKEDQFIEYHSKGIEQPRPYPMVVLINRGSASASEIVAGCLKDHRIAIVLGTKTFGKASVQTVIPMRDGSALRLTTAKYFTPSGNLIHGVGIPPDIEVPFKRIEYETSAEEEKQRKIAAIFNRVDEISGKRPDDKSSQKASSIFKKPSDDDELDNQILRAMDLIQALNVYGVKTDERWKK